MSDWICPGFSLHAKKIYINLPQSQQRDIVHLAQHLNRLVEEEKTILVDNSVAPHEYRFFCKGITVRFKILPQSKTPVFLNISI